MFAFSHSARGQFKEDAFTQNYNDQNDSTARADTTDKLFSFKEYFGGLAHKNELKIGKVIIPSMIVPGTAQIYNKDYWKLPIIYTGLGVTAGLGGYYMNSYVKSKKAYTNAYNDTRTQLEAEGASMTDEIDQALQAQYLKPKHRTAGIWLLAGCGAVYWASLMDGVTCYNKGQHPLPGRATLYSALLPGLGQAYNGEYWKIPIYQGCLVGSIHFLYTNNLNYKRFKWIHNQATNPDVAYDGPVAAETAKYYRDLYRRYRDYSIVATVLFYALQIIDANVFAYMRDFEMSDDLSLNLEPSVIVPDNAYAMRGCSIDPTRAAIGLRLGLTF